MQFEIDELNAAIGPLFTALPIDLAMKQLVVRSGASDELLHCAEKVISDPYIATRPYLIAGVWLYVDELDRSHTVSQGIDDATGAFWHGIMHRREGDFGNSHYWFDRVGSHPAMANIPEYDAHAFIDEVAACEPNAPDPLIVKQRAEWQALFDWCARQ